MRSKNGGDGGTGVYMREGTTSRVMAADRTYSKFYDFYSVSPENFGSTHVNMRISQKITSQCTNFGLFIFNSNKECRCKLNHYFSIGFTISNGGEHGIYILKMLTP